MDNPEHPHAASSGGEMGSEHAEYRQLAKALAGELSRYRILAEDARRSGNTELADRLDNYARDFTEKNTNEFVEEHVNHTWEAVQKLTRAERGQELVAIGFQEGSPATEVLFSKIRMMLLGREDLGDVEPEELEGGATRYSIPMKGRMRYVETYNPPSGEGMIDAEIFKDPAR